MLLRYPWQKKPTDPLVPTLPTEPTTPAPSDGQLIDQRPDFNYLNRGGITGGGSLPPAPIAPTDFGGGLPVQQTRQITDARTATAPLGFDAAKWANPDWNTIKYRAGSILAGGGKIGDVLRDPLFQGWTAQGDDAIKAPDGTVFDLYFDFGGPNQRVQWTQLGNGPNDPRPGDPWDRAAAAGTPYSAALTAFLKASPGDPRPGSPEQRAQMNGGFDPLTGYRIGGATTGPTGAASPAASWSDSRTDPSATTAVGTGYEASPNTDLYVNEILSRLQQLRQPVTDPMSSLLQLLALTRVEDLGGAPYTAGEDAAMRAHYLEPLTQARDTQRQSAIERLGARGITPSSGLFQDQAYGSIDQGYQKAVAGAANDTALQAIDEKQRRKDQQLQILSNLTSLSGQQRAEDDQRGQQLVSTAGLLPALDERRLNLMLDASGQGSQDQSQLMATLMNLLQLENQQSQFASQQAWQQQVYGQQTDQQNADAWGAFLGNLLENL